MKNRGFAALALTGFAVALVGSSAGCASASDGEDVGTEEDELRQSSDHHWFYTGPLPELRRPEVTISLEGHTARVRGWLAADTELPDLPHAFIKLEGNEKQIDLVYPIATAAKPSDDPNAGNYEFFRAVLFRPDGMTTSSSGTSFVTWGGFPFLAYNGGIAMHGPISGEDNRTSSPDFDVWYLRRGTVSHGCNRMLGEHVVELAHVLGMSMRKVYDGNRNYTPPADIGVKVIDGYDKHGSKFVDVDYPTHTGVTRPAKVHGADNVRMFGSWVAKEMPNGADLPSQKQWEGGASGDWYKFQEHAKLNWVCSMPRDILLKLRDVQNASPDKTLSKKLCEQKSCVIKSLRANRNARTDCGI